MSLRLFLSFSKRVCILRQQTCGSYFSTASTSPEEAKKGLGSLVLFLPSVLCGGLAYWQYERMAWKDSLIKVRNESLKAPARDIYVGGEPRDHEKVEVSGVLMHEKSIFVGPRPRSIPGQGVQSGFILVTPLYDTRRNGAVMVNRGWVPRSWEGDLSALEKSAPSGSGSTPLKKGHAPARVTVVGVVQPSEKPSAAMPDNVPDRLEFHWVDVPSLARSCGLPPDTPLVQVISDDPGTAQRMKMQSPLDARRGAEIGPPSVNPEFPIPKNAKDLVKFSTMPSDHMMYAATWAMLCVSLGFMARSAVFYPRKYRRLIHSSNQAHWEGVIKRE